MRKKKSLFDIDVVFREVASGAKADRVQLRRLLGQLEAGDVLMMTRLDRLARSTRDPLNTLGTIADRKAGFRSTGRHHDLARTANVDRARRPC
jgi:DNA invertase Pin-like site-specific DNA recombinase